MYGISCQVYDDHSLNSSGVGLVACFLFYPLTRMITLDHASLDFGCIDCGVFQQLHELDEAQSIYAQSFCGEISSFSVSSFSTALSRVSQSSILAQELLVCLIISQNPNRKRPLSHSKLHLFQCAAPRADLHIRSGGLSLHRGRKSFAHNSQ
jgi:hypothetical protein